MDGAKHTTDTPEAFVKKVLVGRRTFCAEVFPGGRMEREVSRILVLVRSNYPENG